MLFFTTCCIYKGTSYIYLFNNCKEKSTFSTRPRGFKRPNISRNTCWNCNFSLPFKNLPLELHLIETPLQKPGQNSLHQILNISHFSRFTLNISGQQCMGLEAALAWEICTFGLTKKLPCLHSSFTKETIELYCDLWKLFYSKRADIIVGIQLI